MPRISCAVTWASRFVRLLYYCVLILTITVHWLNKYITYLCICYLKLELTGFGSEVLLHTPMVWRWHTKSVCNISELLNRHTNMKVKVLLVAMHSSEFPYTNATNWIILVCFIFVLCLVLWRRVLLARQCFSN